MPDIIVAKPSSRISTYPYLGLPAEATHWARPKRKLLRPSLLSCLFMPLFLRHSSRLTVPTLLRSEENPTSYSRTGGERRADDSLVSSLDEDETKEAMLKHRRDVKMKNLSSECISSSLSSVAERMAVFERCLTLYYLERYRVPTQKVSPKPQQILILEMVSSLG